MRDVYRNATFCIAATAAEDGTRGLFFDRDTQAFQSFKVEARKKFYEQLGGKHDKDYPQPEAYWCGPHPVVPHHAFDPAPLNRRAWVSQERFFSPRILHFSRDILFWECQESFTSETHTYISSRCSCPGSDLHAQLVKQVLNAHRNRQRDQARVTHHGSYNNSLDMLEHDKLYLAWCDYRELYTRCQLTNVDDILAALRGIAQEFEELLYDKLIFGLWKGRLVHDLAWYCHARRYGAKPPTWPAPTWSWVKIAGVIKRDPFSLHVQNVSLAQEVIEIENLPVESKASMTS